jgi:hypothetical protein
MVDTSSLIPNLHKVDEKKYQINRHQYVELNNKRIQLIMKEKLNSTYERQVKNALKFRGAM